MVRDFSSGIVSWLTSTHLEGVFWGFHDGQPHHEIWEANSDTKHDSHRVWKPIHQLSRYAIHMVPTDALRVERFIQGLANLIFTMLSSYVRRITYAEAVNTALWIEAENIERIASKEATKKPNVKGSFFGELSLGGYLIQRASNRIHKVGPYLLSPPWWVL